jgi:NADPH-dependent F420 reductase
MSCARNLEPTNPEKRSSAGMKVAVVGGTAGLGFALAVRLAAARQEVIIGSRAAEKGVMMADKAKTMVPDGLIEGGDNTNVVQDAEIVVVAVPFVGQAEIYRGIKDALPQGAPVLDCTVPLAAEVGGKATRMLGVWEGSAAQQAKAILGRDHSLASGFHSVTAGLLEAIDKPLEEDVLVCGEPEAKGAVEAMVGSIKGARFIDCGPLENARILESLTALLITLNRRYKVQPGAGIRITNLPPNPGTP